MATSVRPSSPRVRLRPSPPLLGVRARSPTPTSAYGGQVRIYKVLDISTESKAWRAAKGIECAQGTECYPPALAKTLQLRQSYKQLHGL